jgi:hypothetical protein
MSDFKETTRRSLLGCAKWLEEHAETLAETFSNGNRHWEVTFSAGEYGCFPIVDVHVEADNIVISDDEMDYGYDHE